MEALEIMEVTTRIGWLATENLKPTDGKGNEQELEKYSIEMGRAKLTAEKAKDWFNFCRVFIEALGRLTPTMQR